MNKQYQKGYRFNTVINQITMVKGDSSNRAVLNMKEWPIVSSSEWTGTFNVTSVNSISPAPLVSGALTVNTDGVFELMITPTESAQLPVGVLWLTCIVSRQLTGETSPSVVLNIVNCPITILKNTGS